jgi:hypothetical protein
VHLQTRDQQAQTRLNAALSGPDYWDSAVTSTHARMLYDEIRLRPTKDGYMAMITGEGQQDIAHDVVVSTIFANQNLLPNHISGAKKVVTLGTGTDPRFGVPYRDSFYFLDLTLFYATYAQRMYKIKDGDRTILYFEKLNATFVDAATWQAYQAQIEGVSESVNRRWALHSVVPIDQVYGLFIVSPGQTHTSRVTFVSKLSFNEDAGWLINFASELPAVIRGGLKSGFLGCVAVARELSDG